MVDKDSPRPPASPIDGRIPQPWRWQDGSIAPGAGILAMIAGGLLLTVNDAIQKWMTADFPTGQMLAMRGVFVLLAIAAILPLRGGLGAIRVHRWQGHLVRGAIVCGSSYLFVTGLAYLPLADAIALTFASPLFITALAPVFLSEKVGVRRWLAVLAGFGGVLIMLRPGADAFHWAALLPLSVAMLGAFRDIVTRRIHESETTLSILFTSSAFVTLAGLASLPFGWRPMSADQILLFAVNGVFLAGAHFLMIEALRLAEAALIAPFKYVTLLWGVLFGFALWGDLPDGWTAAGSLLVVASGLYIWRRESRLRKR